MAIQQAIANSFKKQLLEADHNFASAGGDTNLKSLFIVPLLL
jgi:hypothetical protein